MEATPENGPIDGSTAATPSRLPEAPKKMNGKAFAAKALRLPEPSSLTIDEQMAG
jgi:hypothetical protein